MKILPHPTATTCKVHYLERLNLPFLLIATCPICSKEVTCDLMKKDFHTSAFTMPQKVYFCCQPCEEDEENEYGGEWEEVISVEVSVKIRCEK